MSPTVRRTPLALALALTLAAVAPSLAQASISPTLTATPSSTAAGSSVSLTTDIKFAPSSGDSPKNLTLNLPAGLLSNAAIDGGACLKTATPVAACQVGTGTAYATVVGGIVPVTESLTFYLVAPPKPADLAGLYIQSGGAQLGSTGEVSVRPASDPRGVGVNVLFANIPNQSSGVSASVTELQTTLTGVRMPTACPSPAATLVVTATSYSDATTKTTSAPLSVTGCNGLPFTPSFAITAVRDSADNGVAVNTDIKQPASPAQATDRAAVLTLPTSSFAPNVAAVVGGGILCPSVSSSCKAIGSASSSSPLYPTALTGKAYLIGSLSNINNISLALVFPPPFALTLLGSVNVNQGTTTFTGLPDLPLTDLKVSLFGGPNAVFTATCNPASGTASSTLTTQNGDRTVTAGAPFTVASCPPPSTGGGGTGGGGTGGGGTGGGGTGGGGTGGSGGGHAHSPAPGRPGVGASRLSGVGSGHPVLRFTVASGAHAGKLKSITIVLPAGLGLRRGRRHHPGTTVTIKGARLGRVTMRHGRIVITLRQAAHRFTITVRGLTESKALQRRIKRRHIKHLGVAVITTDNAGRRTLLAPTFAVALR